MGKKVIKNSSVHTGWKGGIEIFSSQQVTLDGNTVHDVKETGITVKSSTKLEILNNHVSGVSIGLRKVPKESAPGYELPDANGIVVRNNTASGVAHKGYMMPAARVCDQSDPNIIIDGNIAHSNYIGIDP